MTTPHDARWLMAVGHGHPGPVPSGWLSHSDGSAVDRGYAAHPADLRVLSRVVVRTGPTGMGDPSRERVAAVLDVETTGFDPDHDAIIELAARRIAFDPAGVITRIGRPFSWLEDPGVRLEDRIVQLTGITDADLRDSSIDEAAALAVLGKVDVIVAHNASFDRPFVERRLPALAGGAWACSCREVDWAGRGLEGRSLGWLCAQAGWFFEGHRGGADVDALIQLLGHVSPTGVAALGELVDTASTSGWIVHAVGAPFAAKDRLKARGYRWDPDARAWWTEVADDDRGMETLWLAAEVYPPTWSRTTDEPRFTAIDWRSRHG